MVEMTFRYLLEAEESSGDPYEGTKRLVHPEHVSELILGQARRMLGRRHPITHKAWLMRIFLSHDPYSCILNSLDKWEDREEVIGDLLSSFLWHDVPLAVEIDTGTFLDGGLRHDPIREARYLQTIASILVVDGRFELATRFAGESLKVLDGVRGLAAYE